MSTLFTHHSPHFHELIVLTHDEQDVFDTVLAPVLRDNAPHALDELAEQIADLSAHVLLKFSNQVELESKDVKKSPSRTFADFCAHDPYLQEAWESRLKKKHHPSFDVVDVHGHKRHTTFDLLLGAFLLNQFNLATTNKPTASKEEKKDDGKGLELLDRACAYGCFSAITKRHAVKLEKFRAAKPDDKRKWLDELVHDCLHLGDVFWTPGYAQSATLLFVLAQELMDTDQPTLAKTFYQASLEALCMAELLQHDEHSKALMEAIYHGEGLRLAIGSNTKHFDNWTAAAKFVLEVAGLGIEDYNVAQTSAKQRVQGFKLKGHATAPSKPEIKS